MLPQTFITPNTPMGATIVAGGATFRVWAPRAHAVYLNGMFAGVPWLGQTDHELLLKDAHGYWTGFVPDARDGDFYRFYVVGDGNHGYKRDPYARELATDAPFPNCSCVIRDPSSYPWHDQTFVTPDPSDMVVYQLHIGTYAPRRPGAESTFLDVIEKLEYLKALGVNVLQPLPIDEFETTISMGYNGSDLFSPDFGYLVTDPGSLAASLRTINRLLTAKGQPPLSLAHITNGVNQLKAMIDLYHLYGIAVVFDVVYNHAGGFQGDDAALYFWDRANNGDNDQSLYFTNQGWAGGLSFALWKQEVQQFLIDNATYYLTEFHVDGFRYDEVSALIQMNQITGWPFCQDLTDTVRFVKPRALQNAEYWPVTTAVVQAREDRGAGFDVTQHDGFRNAVRGVISQASAGASATVNLEAVANNLYPGEMPDAWRGVTCLENHDLVKSGAGLRMPRLANYAEPTSWYAASRSRVATAILLTAPGLPMLFMGEEFLESEQWNDDFTTSRLNWDGLARGDKAMVDHLRFTQDLIALRCRQPALRGPNVRVSHIHNDNRIVIFHRWLEGSGRDVLIVASLNEATWWGYCVGFPFGGHWLEVFNSDVYQNWVNPWVAGNGGGIDAVSNPLHGFGASGSVIIPANGVVVFARDAGI